MNAGHSTTSTTSSTGCCNGHTSNISSSSSSSGATAVPDDDSTLVLNHNNQNNNNNNNPLFCLSSRRRSSSSSGSHYPHHHSSRRCFLTNHASRTAAAAAVSISPFPLLVLSPKESFAKEDIVSTPQGQQTRRLVESIRQSAAKLPGYGTPDVYYPPSFLGRWRATRSMIVSTTTSSSLLEEYNHPLLFLFSSSSSKERLLSSAPMTRMPFVLTYNVRFIAVGGGSNAGKSTSEATTATMGDDKNNNTSTRSSTVLSSSSSWNDIQVIADRAYNIASFHNALTSKLLEEEKQETGGGTTAAGEQEIKDGKDRLVLLPLIQKIDWSPSNPNTCTMYYGDGSWKEIRVTKRATELDVERGTVFSSEYQRISSSSSSSSSSLVNGGDVGGIPSVEAVRVMTKWKIQEKEEGKRNPQVVEGIEIVYWDDTAVMGGGGTAITTTPNASSSASAKVVMKSRLKLERIV